MVSIPIDIVNHICEFAAGKDKVWYPFFSPKTLKVSWKVNPYCSKMHEFARKLLHEIKIVSLTFHNHRTFEQRDFQCRMVVLMKPYRDNYNYKLYIEFDLDNDIYSNYMIRGMLNVCNYYYFKNDILYLKGAQYTDVKWGCLSNILWPSRGTEKIFIEVEI